MKGDCRRGLYQRLVVGHSSNVCSIAWYELYSSRIPEFCLSGSFLYRPMPKMHHIQSRFGSTSETLVYGVYKTAFPDYLASFRAHVVALQQV